MVNTVIGAFPKEKREAKKDGSKIINVAECFSNTIQGENWAGYPATFLRLQRCTLNCVWCDTAEVWRHGNPYSVNELIQIFDDEGVIESLKGGQHLILTGGSPLLQQDALVQLIEYIEARYQFKPFIEIENECTLMPRPEMIEYVDWWNNSPKLANSGNKTRFRYKPDVLHTLNQLENSWFKFVIADEDDWAEIKKDFINPGLIKKNKIVLMPEGASREELQEKYNFVIDMCCREGVRFSDRMQVTAWDKTTGV